MKKVLVEMEKLKNPNSGLGQFCLHLGQHFSLIDPKDLSLNFYVPKTQRSIFGKQFGYLDHSFLHKMIPFGDKRTDVWHCIHQQSKYLPSSSGTKLILTIHDLNFLQKYSGIKRKAHLNALQRKMDRASALTFISEFTMEETKKNLRLPDVPMQVIYNGNSLRVFDNAARPAFVPQGKFIFTIGIIAAKKNFHVLVDMVKEIPDLSVVIAGSKAGSYANELLEVAQKLGIADRVILPGIVSEEDKYWLYKNCEAFVFPSLAEGFGLPVVEALSCGKPVFLSDATSLPEIGGAAAFYWTDFAPVEMKKIFEKGMHTFHSDPSHAQKCMAQAAKFSWKKAAEEYLELYRRI